MSDVHKWLEKGNCAPNETAFEPRDSGQPSAAWPNREAVRDVIMVLVREGRTPARCALQSQRRAFWRVVLCVLIRGHGHAASELDDVAVGVGDIRERVTRGVLSAFYDATASVDHGCDCVVES